jgi:2-keto-4-pentenoate hydratase/2-oxohepta-3-ene-1,7-dioic acid hydratase in catechol pathway
VIGRRVPRHVGEADALRFSFGYSCFNDCRCATSRSARRSGHRQELRRHRRFGPVLVTADELAPGATGLRIQSRLNGQVMQDANTSDMIFSVAETIALLAQCMTLEPGDVLVMGTPAGVGQARTPPVWMKAGDTIEIEIERIGTLANPIVAEAA